MQAYTKTLRISLFTFFFLQLGINGQEQLPQNRQTSDLTSITEAQRAVLSETAKYLLELKEKEASTVLCLNGEIAAQYKLEEANPCNTENPQFAAEALSSKQEVIKIRKNAAEEQKELVSEAVAKSEDKTFSKIEKNQKREIETIIENKEKELSETREPAEINRINEKADRLQMEVNERVTKEKIDFSKKNEQKIEIFEKEVSELNYQEKAVAANLTVLLDKNPQIDFNRKNKFNFEKFKLAFQTEAAQNKISESKQNFLSLTDNTSEEFISETDDLYFSANSEILQHNYSRAAQIFQAFANGSEGEIPIETQPTSGLVIKYRKCGAKTFDNESSSNTTLNVELARYKIRAISASGEHKCDIYNTHLDKHKIVFDFNNSKEKICAKPIEQDTTCPRLQ